LDPLALLSVGMVLFMGQRFVMLEPILDVSQTVQDLNRTSHVLKEPIQPLQSALAFQDILFREAHASLHVMMGK
jgi:hypothetical protein